MSMAKFNAAEVSALQDGGNEVFILNIQNDNVVFGYIYIHF